MKSRTIRLLVLWNVVLTTVVILLAALYASAAQAASDPPVRMFQETVDQDHVAGGKGLTSTKPVEVALRDRWTLIQTMTLNLAGNHNHECALIASSNVSNAPGNSEDNKYELIMTLDDPDPKLDLATTPYIDFDNGRSVTDHNDMEVTASVLYHATNEVHTVYWFAKKISEHANPPSKMTVVNNTLTASCVKNLQP